MIEIAGSHILSCLLVTSVKGGVIILVVYCITSLGKKWSPGVRHLLWLCALMSFVLLPVCTALIQPLRISIFKLPVYEGEFYKSLTNVITNPSAADQSGPVLLSAASGFSAPGIN